MTETSTDLQRVLLYDPERCTGCMNCEISCVFYHFKSLDLQKAHLHIHFAEETGEFEAVYCLRCEDPLCLASCPSEAIVKDQKTGWVTINPVRCIGCKNCTFCCPLSVPWFDERHQASMKCDFCNGEPRCAMVCSPKAIRFTQRYSLINSHRDAMNVKNEVDLARCCSCGAYFLPEEQIKWALARVTEKVQRSKDYSRGLDQAVRICHQCREQIANIRRAKNILYSISSHAEQ